MSDASVVFLPWVRQGLAARISVPDPLKTALPAQAPLTVTLAVNSVEAPPVQVRLFGPADVLGIDPRQVVRTEPPAGTNDYESNDLAAIEFDNPDLPWLFTPAAADTQGRVRPWIALVVVPVRDGVRLRAPREEPLPVLEIAPPAIPSAELPDLSESWAWAHAQLGTHENATEDELRTVLASRPDLSISCLISSRLLAPFTDYIACVVPAFESGRRVGLGQSVDAGAQLEPAWASGANAPANIVLPVYYSWRFRTGAREDFESLVARLSPRDFSDTVGRRPLDITAPGFPVPPAMTPAVMLEGALQPVGTRRDPFPDSTTTVWRDQLQSIVNSANAQSIDANAEPVLGPPIYGRWIAGRHEVGKAPARTWLDELNLDPRERVVAALGTRVIQEQQEDLMAQAWDQAGEMSEANQRLRQMQLSFAIGSTLHARNVRRMNDDDALWRFASPAQSRLIMKTAAQGTPALTMRSMLASSSTPDVTTSAPMRRLSRPLGAISRRASTALRVAGMQAPASTAASGVSSMFRLFGAQPIGITFTLPPTRGLISFDAVTRRLPAQFSGMTFARGTDAAVAGMAPRPAFAVSGEPLILVGTFHTDVDAGVLVRTAVAPAAPLRRPGSDEPRDPIDPREIPDDRRPTDPVIIRPPRVDSADAKVFREAAVRHLHVVNPQQPLVFVQPAKRAALEFAAVRVQIRNALDPAPVFNARVAASIRLQDEHDTTPPALGTVGTAPVFTQPMSEPLASLSQDWLLPGLERVSLDSVALLEPNQRFIEAYMLGLNVEMARELLWRDFVVNDPRATFFRRFWRAVSAQQDGDVAPLAAWADRHLGDNKAAPNAPKQTVLLVRSALFRRYPGASVYAVPALPVRGGGRKPGAQESEIHPLFRGALQPDVTFFGFELDAKVATGDPGWYFVIQEQPTEPRFGFDVEIDFGNATHVPLAAPPAGHALPPGTRWAFNAAHMAQITRQQPVRIAIHASELIKS
jgi:hypothetical protein